LVPNQVELFRSLISFQLEDLVSDRGAWIDDWVDLARDNQGDRKSSRVWTLHQIWSLSDNCQCQ